MGAQYIGEALQYNQVLRIETLNIYHHCWFFQTLTSILLSWNPIKNAGASHIREALKYNQVLDIESLSMSELFIRVDPNNFRALKQSY